VVKQEDHQVINKEVANQVVERVKEVVEKEVVEKANNNNKKMVNSLPTSWE